MLISSLLIANRGEIAVRIIKTAKQMGIRTVAVFSDADSESLHVTEADECIHIGPSNVSDSYLNIESLINVLLVKPFDVTLSIPIKRNVIINKQKVKRSFVFCVCSETVKYDRT